MSSDQNDKAAGAAREELKEARMRIEALSYQLSGLQKQVKGLNFISNTQLFCVNILTFSEYYTEKSLLCSFGREKGVNFLSGPAWMPGGLFLVLCA